MKKIVLSLTAIVGIAFVGQSQELLNMRSYDKNGVNVFEPKKDTLSTSEDVYVKIGGAFALQFQNLHHQNKESSIMKTDPDTGLPTTTPINRLYAIGNNFNLATANLDLDVRLYDGINMHLRTYLSSRHHPEPYVKGGYITVDNLNFIQEGFLEDLMKSVTFKFGHMENNYGDAHFRRSDNASAIYNPFVGNYIMDAFTTEVGAEVYYQNNGLLAMVGVSNGRLNQRAQGGTSPTTLLKLGYDKQINSDLRLRLTGSMYHTAQTERAYLYAADRAGSRYYFVMEQEGATSQANFRSGRFDPADTTIGSLYNPTPWTKMTAFMVNPFVKYKGLEFFGLAEFTSGKRTSETDTRDATQFAGELLYRFGAKENFYVGGRYNTVSAKLFTTEDVTIDRFNVGAGWFMTNNILVKLEYVNQTYDGYNVDSVFHEGKFNGFVAEAVISF